jgi:hypothetical protein
VKYLLGLLALLVAVPLAATTGSLFDDGLPPKAYQGDAAILVHYVSRPLPEAPCGVHLGPGWILNGCALSGRMENYLPNPCSKEFAGQSFARYACHEKGHSLGWAADHPR